MSSDGHAWTPAPQSKPGVPGPYRPVGQSVVGFSLFCPSPKDDIDTETELHLVISPLRILDKRNPTRLPSYKLGSIKLDVVLGD